MLLGDRAYTSRDVAALAGVPVYRARRFWRALGFPNVAEDAVEFTAADVEALVLLLRIVADGVVDEQAAVQLTRSLGQAAARLAESQAEVALRGTGDTSVDAAHLVRRLLPDLQHLLVYAWQRHLAAAMNRLDQMNQQTGATSLAVGFADVVAFTRLTRQLELAQLAQLVERSKAGPLT
jgi:adenylate cyclase